MQNNLGYSKPLYILAFDHRSSFLKNLLGVENRQPTNEETQKVINLKKIIYEGFKKTLNNLTLENAAILVDEQFGDEILRDAKENNYTFILPTEKSGAKEFDFEYENFPEHIEKYKPNFVKALVRFNPEENNTNQLEKLKILNDYLHDNNYKFLVELLVLPGNTQEQNTTKEDFDTSVRPRLTVETVKIFQDNFIEPDVWKIEGMNIGQNYEKIVEQVRINGRDNIGIVVLGRGESKDQVENWLVNAKGIDGITGFAIGRTIFWEPIENYHKGNISREKAINMIAQNYIYFYNIFTKT